jgi:uroporphyrinogen-III synthase
VFTSANGVAALADRLRACGHNPSDLAAVRIAAVGPATAAAVAALGLEVRVVPIARDAAALAGELRHRVDRGARMLYPRAAIGRETLQEELRAAGVSVIDVAAYRTLPEHEVDGEVLTRVRRGDADAVTFFSPSSVHNFLALVASAGAGTAISAIPAICAGPGIAEAAGAAGLRVVATSESPSDAAVVAAAAVWWRGRKGPREDARASQHLVLAGRSTE